MNGTSNRRFELEVLEQRVLLDAAMPAMLATDPLVDSALTVIQAEQGATATGADQAISYNPQANVDSIFEGAGATLETAASEPSNSTETAPAAASSEGSTATQNSPAADQTSTAAAVDPGISNPIPEQLTTTLRGANGPPESDSINELLAYSFANSTDSFTGSSGGPLRPASLPFMTALAVGTTLNSVIDALLAAHFPPSNPNPPDATYTNANDPTRVPTIVTIGRTPGGGVDLQLENITLTFSRMVYASGRWTGDVGVEAEKGVLFAGLLDINLVDDGQVGSDEGDDPDSFAVVGRIDLGAGAAQMNMDDVDAEELGFPGFLDINFTDLALKFTDFRGDDNLNSLHLELALTGFDTGNDTLNDLLSSDNPLFGLSIQGSASGTLAIKEIEDTVVAAGNGDWKGAMQSALAAAVASDLDGLAGRVSGKLFHVGSISGTFIYHKITVDPDGPGPDAEKSSGYIAIEGGFDIGDELGGGRSTKFDIAFAISDLGPLQFFIYGGPFKLVDPLILEEAHLGVRFNTTIEELQTETDFNATAAFATPIAGSTDYRVTMTIPGHDLEVGNDFRVSNALNDFYNGDFSVVAVNGNQVMFDVEGDPGSFNGSAKVIRLTITDPLDLRDEGLEAGITPPEDIFVWRTQLDQAVRNQIETGDNVWEQLIHDVVIGGGGTLSIEGIPDTVLQFMVDLLIDSHGRIMLTGKLSLIDGLVEVPAKAYGDLSDLADGSGRLLFLCDIPDFPVDSDPLLVLRGEVSFEPLEAAEVMNAVVTRNTTSGFWEIKVTVPFDNPSDEYAIGNKAVIFGSHPPTGTFNFDGTYDVIAVDDGTNTITLKSPTHPGTWAAGSEGSIANENVLEGGFRIVIEGGIDLNIPGFKSNGDPYTVTTLTLEGGAEIEFRRPGPSVAYDLAMNFSFEATLSETNLGRIAEADGAFHATLDVQQGVRSAVEIWGAALLTTNFEFLQNIGLFATASGLLRINSSDADKPAEQLRDVNNRMIVVALPRRSFALRLDGSVDFRIDFNGDHTFSTSESVFEIAGAFVLEFGTDGFNVAVFRDGGGTIRPATLRLGPHGATFLTFDVFAFLAIRKNGIAANLVLSLSLGSSGPLSSVISLNARFVFVVNTTGQQVVFNIPGGAADPNRPGVSVVTIPRAGPADPAAVAGATFDSLIAGNGWTNEAAPGPYGVLLFNGSMTFLSIITLNASGFVTLNPGGLILQVSVSGNFLSLVSIGGTIAFNTDGEFYMNLNGSLTLGSSSTNISGSASLTLSYLDSNGMALLGDGNKALAISGSLSVSAKVFGISLGSLTLYIRYANDTLSVGVPYPEPFWDSSCTSTFFGDICVYYPNVRTAYYWFTIGTLRVGPTPVPPVVLGQVDGNGVLTLNVGASAGARNLLLDEVNESVIIEGAPGSQRGQKITITMFGVSRDFDDVTDIQVGDMAVGSDVVEIADNVTVPVTVHFGPGSDTLMNHGPAVATAYGDGDNDRLTGGTGNDRLYGGLGDDFTDGQGGQDWIEGGDGSDVLIGGEGGDTIKGGAGIDQIAGDLATLAGDGLGSTLQTQASSAAGNDTIEGGEDIDFIMAGGGQDNIVGGPGADVLMGDDGTVSVSSLAGFTFTVVDLEFGAADVIEGGIGRDKIFGGRGDDILKGGAQDDEISGGVGQDSITWLVGEGNDHIDGQSGSDTLSVVGTASGPAGVTVTAKDAGFTVNIGAETLSVDGVETADIDGRQGLDQFLINDLTTSVLRQVNLKFGDGSDAATVNGSSNDDIFTITPISNIVRVQKTGGATMDIFDASAPDSIVLKTREGTDTVNVLGTRDGTATAVYTGAGADTINVGSLAPAIGGTVNGIAAALWVDGESDSDTLNVDDSGDTAANTGFLANTTITGLGMAGTIFYAGFQALNIGLGSGSDIFVIQSTHAGTTRLDTNAGNDTVHVDGTGGVTTINTGAGLDIVNVRASGGPAMINTGEDNDTINLSSNADINSGTLDGLSGVLTIDAGAGVNTLNVSDEASGSPDLNAVITANSITGFGPMAIYYAATGGTFGGGINIEAGFGGNHIEVRSTNSTPGTTTTLWSGNGADVVTVTGTDAGSLVIHGQAGNDLIDGAGATTGLVITGDSQDDIITGGSGNDVIIGNDGDDQIVGGAGSDDISGGEGRDVLVGDTGVIVRAYNTDGSSRSNVLLTDVGRIDASYNLNGFKWADLNAALASAILNADLVLLTGAYNTDGSRHLTRDAWGCQQWDTRLLLISLVAGGNDTLDGGAGDDALFAGRGNDSVTGGAGRDYIEGGAGDDTLDGGDGDDVLVGDNSTVLTTDGALPNVMHGLRLTSASDVTGTTLVPLMTILPGHDIDALTSVLPHITGDVALVPAVNALVDTNGTRHVPLAAVVPEIAHHRALLAGNDTLRGGAGNDLLTGDNSTTLVRSLDVTPELMARAERTADDLLRVSDDWADLADDLYRAVAGRSHDHDDKQTTVVDGTFQIGNDTLNGGAGVDILVGDNSILSAPSIAVPLRLADDLHGLLEDLDWVADEFADASRTLSDLQHLLRDVVTKVPYKKGFQINVEHHINRLLVGNDTLEGGDGNDLLVGDNWSRLAPSITVTGKTVPACWNKDPHERDDDWGRGDSDWDHHCRNDLLIVGNDTLNGGAGNDLMFGDSAAILAATVTVSSDVKRSDSSAALHEGAEIVEHLLGFERRGWFHEHDDDDHDHDHDYDVGGGDDVVNGGDGDDIMFGQAGADTLRGGAGNDWLIGGDDKDVLDDTIGQNKLRQGEDDSKALRETLASRLNEFGLYDDSCKTRQPPTIKCKVPRILALG